MPYVNLIIAYITKQVFIFMDKGCSRDPFKTKCKTMAAYKATYVGPDYLVHYSYSNALTICYTAFLFGIQMPILFPIAAFALMNTCITDRILVAYYYSLPPSMSNKLNS